MVNTASAGGCPFACGGGMPVKPLTLMGEGMLVTVGALMPGGVLPPGGHTDRGRQTDRGQGELSADVRPDALKLAQMSGGPVQWSRRRH